MKKKKPESREGCEQKIESKKENDFEIIILNQIFEELKKIQKQQGVLMANVQDALNKISEFGVALDKLILEETNARNRFEQKLVLLSAQIEALQGQVAAGAETAPIIEAVNSLSGKVENETAAATVSGL